MNLNPPPTWRIVPMSKHRSYSEKLKDPRWQRVRLEVLERAGWKCEACGATESTLHAHHGYYDRKLEPWEYNTLTLWCLCEECHKTAETARLEFYAACAHLSPLSLQAFYVTEIWDSEHEADAVRRGDPLAGSGENNSRSQLVRLRHSVEAAAQ